MYVLFNHLKNPFKIGEIDSVLLVYCMCCYNKRFLSLMINIFSQLTYFRLTAL